MIPGVNVNLWTIEKGDLVQNYIWANDPEIRKLTGMIPEPKSSWDVDMWFNSIHGNPNLIVFAIKTQDGTYIGNVEIKNIDNRSGSAEIGIMVGERSYRRSGLGKEALVMALRFVFEELGLHRIYASVLSFNNPAGNFFENAGFIKEGIEREAHFTWNKYWDIIKYSILADEFFRKHPYRPIETPKPKKDMPEVKKDLPEVKKDLPEVKKDEQKKPAVEQMLSEKEVEEAFYPDIDRENIPDEPEF